MRLINTQTLDLEEFQGAAPEYAILSHTWEDGEVSLQEFIKPGMEIKEKQGYSKITATCHQARLDDIGYCWVDACCI